MSPPMRTPEKCLTKPTDIKSLQSRKSLIQSVLFFKEGSFFKMLQMGFSSSLVKQNTQE